MAHSILPYGAITYVPLARTGDPGPVVSRWCERDRHHQQLIHGAGRAARTADSLTFRRVGGITQVGCGARKG